MHLGADDTGAISTTSPGVFSTSSPRKLPGVVTSRERLFG
jgi:hypothetical protein